MNKGKEKTSWKNVWKNLTTNPKKDSNLLLLNLFAKRFLMSPRSQVRNKKRNWINGTDQLSNWQNFSTLRRIICQELPWDNSLVLKISLIKMYFKNFLEWWIWMDKQLRIPWGYYLKSFTHQQKLKQWIGSYNNLEKNI